MVTQRQVKIIGLPQLEKTLEGMASKAADKVSVSALGGGLAVLRTEIRKEAPQGESGGVKKEIGARFIKAKGKLQKVSAKAGVGVGKRKRTDDRKKGSKKTYKEAVGPHGHLVALGTDDRFREKIGGRFAYITNATLEQLHTGRMDPNAFVERGKTKAQPKILPAMLKRAKKALTREAVKMARAYPGRRTSTMR